MKDTQEETILIPDEFIPDYPLTKEERDKQRQEWIEKSNKAFEKLLPELSAALELYDKTFDSFPTIPLLRDNSEEKVIDIINDCIANKKDVYEMGYLELSLDIHY